jgi:hypothetical protein
LLKRTILYTYSTLPDDVCTTILIWYTVTSPALSFHAMRCFVVLMISDVGWAIWGGYTDADERNGTGMRNAIDEAVMMMNGVRDVMLGEGGRW